MARVLLAMGAKPVPQALTLGKAGVYCGAKAAVMVPILRIASAWAPVASVSCIFRWMLVQPFSKALGTRFGLNATSWFHPLPAKANRAAHDTTVLRRAHVLVLGEYPSEYLIGRIPNFKGNLGDRKIRHFQKFADSLHPQLC